MKNVTRFLITVIISTTFTLGMIWWDGFAPGQASFSLIEPDGVNDKIGEADDYTSNVWGDPWDMSQSTDVYRAVGFANVTFDNGVFTGVTTSNDAYIWLLHQGYSNANNVGKTGLVRPIDASVYRRIAFKMYRDLDNVNVPIRVYWYKMGDEVTGQPCGVTTGIPMKLTRTLPSSGIVGILTIVLQRSRCTTTPII